MKTVLLESKKFNENTPVKYSKVILRDVIEDEIITVYKQNVSLLDVFNQADKEGFTVISMFNLKNKNSTDNSQLIWDIENGLVKKNKFYIV
ncbi:hypothetical protein AALK46_13070 [Staphylococcus nepalensis]|uniref:hypothetical protein n=1 Tax=Staphylococcus TaxID=1279 RepID=UPI002DB6F5D2|nr:hypothetical protein [Staphylococcus pseudoxylosus]MEB6038051.1 hypothetical protein [Staphylococcus pseudoxylosus]